MFVCFNFVWLLVVWQMCGQVTLAQFAEHSTNHSANSKHSNHGYN